MGESTKKRQAAALDEPRESQNSWNDVENESSPPRQMRVSGSEFGLFPPLPNKTATTKTSIKSQHATGLGALHDGADTAVRFGNAAQPRKPREERSGAVTIGLFGEISDQRHRDVPEQDGVNNLRQITSIAEGAIFDPEIDRSGQWLAVASTMHHAKSDLYLRAIGGTTFTQLTDDPANEVMPAFSPDGKQLAFCSDRSGNWDIYAVPVSGGRPVQITDDPAAELHPTWSPDGRTIAYCKLGEQSGRWEIWTADLAQPGVKRFLIYGMFPQWNPDPAEPKLLFQRARQRGSRFHSTWTVDYLGGEARNPTEIVSAVNAATINPAWSPDGRRITFVTVIEPDSEKSERPSQSDLWVIDADGTEQLSLTGGKYANYQPVWSSDGAIYFVSDRSGAENVWAVTSAEMLQFESGAEIASVDEGAGNPGE